MCLYHFRMWIIIFFLHFKCLSSAGHLIRPLSWSANKKKTEKKIFNSRPTKFCSSLDFWSNFHSNSFSLFVRSIWLWSSAEDKKNRKYHFNDKQDHRSETSITDIIRLFGFNILLLVGADQTNHRSDLHTHIHTGKEINGLSSFHSYTTIQQSKIHLFKYTIKINNFFVSFFSLVISLYTRSSGTRKNSEERRKSEERVNKLQLCVIVKMPIWYRSVVARAQEKQQK